MAAKKTMSFDCSAINRLTDDKESAVLLAAIRTAYSLASRRPTLTESSLSKKKRGRRDDL